MCSVAQASRVRLRLRPAKECGRHGVFELIVGVVTMLISRRNLPAALALGAHAVSLRATPRRDASEVWARTELYFGTNRANRRPVSDSEFSQFIAAHVLERFPGGFTLRTTYGQFLNSRGESIREKSFLVIVFYPSQMRDADARLQEIRERYRQMFQQESVLRVDSLSLVSF